MQGPLKLIRGAALGVQAIRLDQTKPTREFYSRLSILVWAGY